VALAFVHCGLSVVAFEARSRTRGIEQSAFGGCKLNSLWVPAFVEFIEEVRVLRKTEVRVSTSKLTAFRFACDRDLRVGWSGKASFRYCGTSADPLISARFTELGNGGFYDCHDIMALTFGRGGSISQVGKHAFDGGVKLRPIIDPKLIKSLGKSCFRSCHSMQILLFPSRSRLRQIEKSIFSGCTT
jgi:hypothetical protein